MTKRLAAFVVGRRSVAAAIFEGLKLSFWEVRSFQAKPEKAAAAVTGFVNYIIERCEVEAAGLEEMSDDLKTRTAELTRRIQALLREHSIPVSTISANALFGAFTEPPAYSRAILREIALQVFPQLQGALSGKELLDAALLGLYLQTERLLSDY